MENPADFCQMQLPCIYVLYGQVGLTLRSRSYHVTDTLLPLFPSRHRYLTDLRILELVSTGVTGDCFSLLPASVRKVTLRSCPRIREHNFCLVGDRCPQLEELCLSKTRVTSHDIKHIAARWDGIFS